MTDVKHGYFVNDTHGFVRFVRVKFSDQCDLQESRG